MCQDEREIVKIRRLEYKDKYEMQNRGNYERCYPLPGYVVKQSREMQLLSREYEFLVLCSKEVWGE